MSARGAFAPRTRASYRVVRWVRAAVVALLAALAVLIHHETAAIAIGSTSSSAVHLMPHGMLTPSSHAALASATSGHGHGDIALQTVGPAPAAAQAVIGADGPPCSGMAMQHCSSASFEVVKLPAPAQTPVSAGPAPYRGLATGAKAAGAVDRAPPDLSALSQLRI
ncbi:hypothetical protein AB0C70_28585 [Streptomyces sp. NPDC048564]|uniref:hypothetical protein n=1 Tax=Streptomyces sp. NPDC048564 TaxID=3155760 RepID=UPI003449819B